MPDLMVSVTPDPRRMAPPNSQIDATSTACRKDKARAATLVAKELATSLAPIPHATKKARKIEQTKIHCERGTTECQVSNVWRWRERGGAPKGYLHGACPGRNEVMRTFPPERLAALRRRYRVYNVQCSRSKPLLGMYRLQFTPQLSIQETTSSRFSLGVPTLQERSGVATRMELFVFRTEICVNCI